jgi:hypothetical protein
VPDARRQGQSTIARFTTLSGDPCGPWPALAPRTKTHSGQFPTNAPLKLPSRRSVTVRAQQVLQGNFAKNLGNIASVNHWQRAEVALAQTVQHNVGRLVGVQMWQLTEYLAPNDARHCSPTSALVQRIVEDGAKHYTEQSSVFTDEAIAFGHQLARDGD